MYSDELPTYEQVDKLDDRIIELEKKIDVIGKCLLNYFENREMNEEVKILGRKFHIDFLDK